MRSAWSTTLIGVALCTISVRGRAGESAPGKTVVFVCEHGSVKSLIAMQWFNRLAAEQGSEVRAVSRGLRPDRTVPKPVAANLARDGFAVEQFVPKPLVRRDLNTAERVIGIGVTAEDLRAPGARVDEWPDIPPASENYAASRDAIRQRISLLLVEIRRGSRETTREPKGPKD